MVQILKKGTTVMTLQIEDLLRQAHEDAQRIKQLPTVDRERLNRETDWSGSRLMGYQPRPHLRASG